MHPTDRPARTYPRAVDPAELEQALLGAPCELTREDVAAAVGIPVEQATALWTAMGFAEVPTGERAFTRLDVASLRQALALRDSGLVTEDSMRMLARSMGQHLARMAEAQVEVFRSMSAGETAAEVTRAAAVAAAEVRCASRPSAGRS